jgi:3-oxoacyl-[acyl-carrier-protein] synthase-3
VIQIPAGGVMLPFAKMKNPNEACFKMNGRQVYAFAVTRGAEVIREVCDASGVAPSALSMIIPHQANINIIRELAAKVGVEEGKFFVNLDQVGNTAGASIPIALDQALAAGRIKAGDKIALVAFGGGLSWGASLIQY